MLKRNRLVKSNQKKEGQSTVEYIILFAAVIAVLIIFLQPDGIFQRVFNTTLNVGTTQMNDLSGRLGDSHPEG